MLTIAAEAGAGRDGYCTKTLEMYRAGFCES